MLPVMAADIVESGKCGENVTWTLDSNGLLTISGTGDMARPFEPYWDSEAVKRVVINDGVTSICRWAFEYCESLVKVTIPDSVTTIGDHAFLYCKSLRSLIIPDSVTTIGNQVFFDCGIKKITIPDSVVEIGFGAFAPCYNLTEIQVEPNNPYYKSIDGVLFSKDGKKLISCPGGREGKYTIPNGVNVIENGALEYCEFLSNIIIPDSVTTIEPRAFRDCVQLRTVTIPESVTTIGEWSFDECFDLTDIYVNPNNVYYKSVDGVLYSKDGKTLFRVPPCKKGSYTILDGVATIAEHAFDFCNLTEVRIPNSVTIIGNSVFYSCIKLTEITIPKSVLSIGDLAFECCYSLKKVYFLGDVPTEMGSNVFADTHDRFKIYYGKDASGWTTPKWKAHDDEVYNTVGLNRNQSGDLIVPKPTIKASGKCGPNLTWTLNSNGLLTISGTGEMWDQYEMTDTWDKDAIERIVIKEGVTSIGNGVFAECHSLVSVTLPNSLTTIDNYAFFYCNYLQTITIPRGVTTIGESVFDRCTDLMEINVDPQNTRFKSIAGVLYTKNGKKLLLYPDGYLDRHYVIPEGVTVISGGAFQWWSNIVDVTIPESVVVISSYAFDMCRDLKNIYFLGDVPKGLKQFFAPSDLTLYYREGKSGWTSPRWKAPDGTIYKTAIMVEETPKNESEWNCPFTDISKDKDYYEAVQYVYENELFKGVSETEFAPNITMNRAMFVTVLGRLAGINVNEYTKVEFDDVIAGEWYAPYVAWANEKGIVYGYGDGIFGVTDEVSIEQAVVILARYAKYINKYTDSAEITDSYVDINTVSDWAAEDMKWVVNNHIYRGSGNTLNPQYGAQRALVATMLYNFVKLYIEN